MNFRLEQRFDQGTKRTVRDLAKNAWRYYQFIVGVEPRTIIIHRGDRVIPELQHQALSGKAVNKWRNNGVETAKLMLSLGSVAD